MSEWKTYKLGELCSKIGSGSTPKGGSNVYLESGEISLIRSQNIYNEGFNPNGIVYITQESADKLKNVIVNENDVLVNITGDSVARACIVDKKYLPARVNQHTAILRAIPNILDYRYLKNYLINKPIQDYLLSISSSGATRNALTKSMLENLEIQLPDIETQQKIGEFLETFNKKIQLNTQTNQTLEAIAQAIFKSWFVDFDPVRVKAQAILDGKTRDEANLSAMAVICGKAIEDLSQTEYQELWEIADAFPSELVENAEFGEVPKGWEVKKIGEVVERLKNSQKLKKEHISDIGETPVFEQGASILMGYTDEHPSQKATLREPIFIFGDHTCITQISTKPFSIYQNVIALKGLNLPTYWVYWAIKDKQKFQEYRRHYMEFIIKEIIVPNDEILCRHFSNTISFFHQKIDFLREENRHLAKIRDELLPKLLSREIEL